MKKPTKSYLIKKCDKLWALIIKKIASDKCEHCGKTNSLNSHHIFSRSNMRMRHNLKNGVCLCSGCHVFSSTFSAHKAPAEFMDWIRETRGEDWYKDLLEAKNEPPAPITIQYYKNVLTALTEIYDTK